MNTDRLAVKRKEDKEKVKVKQKYGVLTNDDLTYS